MDQLQFNQVELICNILKIFFKRRKRHEFLTEQLMLKISNLHGKIPVGPLITHSGKITTWINSIHRSEEHTSELQSHVNLVCRLLLEKKKKTTPPPPPCPRTPLSTPP